MYTRPATRKIFPHKISEPRLIIVDPHNQVLIGAYHPARIPECSSVPTHT